MGCGGSKDSPKEQKEKKPEQKASTTSNPANESGAHESSSSDNGATSPEGSQRASEGSPAAADEGAEGTEKEPAAAAGEAAPEEGAVAATDAAARASDNGAAAEVDGPENEDHDEEKEEAAVPTDATAPADEAKEEEESAAHEERTADAEGDASTGAEAPAAAAAGDAGGDASEVPAAPTPSDRPAALHKDSVSVSQQDTQLVAGQEGYLGRGPDPDFTIDDVFGCFDEGNGLLFRLVNNKRHMWAFYNDTESYHMHVSVVFGNESMVRPLGQTKQRMMNETTGQCQLDVVVKPGETQMFMRGEYNGFTTRYDAIPSYLEEEAEDLGLGQEAAPAE